MTSWNAGKVPDFSIFTVQLASGIVVYEKPPKKFTLSRASKKNYYQTNLIRRYSSENDKLRKKCKTQYQPKKNIKKKKMNLTNHVVTLTKIIHV